MLCGTKEEILKTMKIISDIFPKKLLKFIQKESLKRPLIWC